MTHIVLVIHLILALSIIGLVLLQRSEGGGLGIGGGGGLGGLATPGATANALTRMTAFCAFGFFCTSLILGVMAGKASHSRSLLDRISDTPAAAAVPATEATVGEEEAAPVEGEAAPAETQEETVPAEAEAPAEDVPVEPEGEATPSVPVE